MLPNHPWVLGRLFHAARDLLGWSQERVAAEAGVSMAAVHALERGRAPVVSQAMLAVMATLERSGVRFLAAADGFGYGVRYAAPGSPESRSASPGLQIVTGHGGIAVPGPAGAAGSRQTHSHRRLAAARARTTRQRQRQRQLVAQLMAAGHDVQLANGLLVQMERALLLMRQSEDLRPGPSSDVSRDDPDHLAVAA